MDKKRCTRTIICLVSTICLVRCVTSQDGSDMDITQLTFGKADTSIRFPCPFHQNDFYFVLWEYGNVTILIHFVTGTTRYGSGFNAISHQFNPRDMALTLNNVLLSQRGIYTCRMAYYDGTTPKLSYYLRVYVTPTVNDVRIVSDTSAIEEGLSREVTCTAPAYPVNTLHFYIKSRNNIVFGPYTGLYNYNDSQALYSASMTRSVTFDRTYNDNDSRLYCEVHFSWNTITEDPVASQSLNVPVYFKPTMITFDMNPINPVLQGSSVAFTCQTDSLNPVTSFTGFNWRKGSMHNTGHTLNGSILDQADGNFNGYTVTGTISFTVDKEDHDKCITCEPVWDNQALTGSMVQSLQLNVQFPPTVVIDICGKTAINNKTGAEACMITCPILEEGNPDHDYSYRWSVRRTFTGVVEALQEASDTYQLDIVGYLDAGDYSCIASNVAGDSREVQATLTVNYAPIALDLDPGSTNMKSLFAALGETSKVLDLTVHSHPRASFTWSKASRQLESESYPLNDTHTSSKVTIQHVDENSYGNYTVAVRSGNSSLSSVYIVVLVARGKPGPPHDIQFDSISYREIRFSFMPGIDGGFEQTISVAYRTEHGDGFIEVNSFVNPPQDQRVTGVIENLEESTVYELRLSADNAFVNGDAEEVTLYITTLENVYVDESEMGIEMEEDKSVNLYWMLPLDAYSRAEILQCHASGGQCVVHNVTARTHIMFHTANGTVFTLVIYQGLDRVYEQRFEYPSSEGNQQKDGESQQTGVIIGVAVSVIVAISVMSAIVAFLLNKKRKKRKQQGPTKEVIAYVVPDRMDQKGGTDFMEQSI